MLEGDNLVTANTFYIRDEHKSVELYTSTREEKEQWLEQLFLAVKSLYTRKSSLRVGREILRPLDSEIGKRPPHMQRVETVARCTDCATRCAHPASSTMNRRRSAGHFGSSGR